MATTNTEDRKNTGAIEQIKTPLLAALGAGNLAGQAVADVLTKARERVTESSEVARKNIEELPSDFESLRGRLDPAELRKLLDEYTDAALKLYHRLAEAGEETWEKLVAQPQVKRNLEQLEETLHTAQGRVDEVASDVRERIDEVVAKVTGRTREVGEQAALKVEDTAAKVEEVTGDVADKVEEAAPSKPKTTTRSTTRRTTSAAKKPANSTSSKTTK
ncbi:hypothetical protein ACFS2C_01570 [Prauserella oleivorans]|uniref:Heparin binding hemagglutinin HbhA n=1 Tax=Prauserella oleivorans TaxID=1478153 RepID=A0ABW5W5A3_9PSEU